MPIFFNIDYRGVDIMAKHAGVAKKRQWDAVRDAMVMVAAYWHANTFPKHFTRGAKGRYRHKRRKRSYKRIKRELALGNKVWDKEQGKLVWIRVVKGGLVDVAFRGPTETKARANRWISGTRNGFTLKMRVPRYITQRRRGSYPDMKRELSMITIEEARELKGVFWKYYRKALAERSSL